MANVRTVEAAQYLGVSKSFLDKARCYGTNGPRFMRFGRAVVYSTEDLDQWARSCTVANDNRPASGEEAA
jgi:predicted DNA-binding transcriptional regulator AlpA